MPHKWQQVGKARVQTASILEESWLVIIFSFHCVFSTLIQSHGLSLVRAHSLSSCLNCNLLISCLRLATEVVGLLLSTLWRSSDLQNLVYLHHQLSSVLYFLQRLNTLSVNFAEILELRLESVGLGPLKNLWCNVVAEAVKHDLFVQLAFLGAALHENEANFLKFFFRHSLDCLFYDSWAELLFAKLAEVETDEFVETADPGV